MQVQSNQYPMQQYPPQQYPPQQYVTPPTNRPDPTSTGTPAPQYSAPMFQSEEGEHFSYDYPIIEHRHHLFMSKKLITVEFEDPKKRRYMSKTVSTSMGTHVSVIEDEGTRKFLMHSRLLMSFIYLLCTFLAWMCAWIAVSPNRPEAALEAAASFNIIAVILVFIFGLAGYSSVLSEWLALRPRHPEKPKTVIAPALYGVSLFFTICTFVCSIAILALLNEGGNGRGYYFFYIACKEGDYDPGDIGYEFASVCDDKMIRWVQAFIVLAFINVVLITLSQLAYFGRILPFFWVLIEDRVNKPVVVSFHGPVMTGFPLRCILARKDAERITSLFHKYYNKDDGPRMRMNLDSVQFGDGGFISGVVNYLKSGPWSLSQWFTIKQQ